tara:strand:+ start:593 stop:931 length:339 start_codon:yes stop_codon:yes gene_type:complete
MAMTTEQIMATIEQIKDQVLKLGSYDFEQNLVSHADQLSELIFHCEELQNSFHPDDDEYETLDIYIGDILQPILDKLEKDQEEYLSDEYIKKQKVALEAGRIWFQKLIGGEQ